jgi:hypothetical protein
LATSSNNIHHITLLIIQKAEDDRSGYGLEISAFCFENFLQLTSVLFKKDFSAKMTQNAPEMQLTLAENKNKNLAGHGSWT